MSINDDRIIEGVQNEVKLICGHIFRGSPYTVDLGHPGVVAHAAGVPDNGRSTSAQVCNSPILEVVRGKSSLRQKQSFGFGN